MGLPPVTYLAIYRANLPAPESELCVASTSDFEIKLLPGPIRFSFTVPVLHYRPSAAGMTAAQQHRELPRNSYVLIQISLSAMDPASAPTARSVAALRVAEATCIFDLRCPGLISEKLHEGTVDKPGQYVFMPEGPLRVTARPAEDPEDVADRIASDLASLQELSAQDRDRFRLAARWFRRGQEAINPVDRFLFFWMVLEICPAMGKGKVSNTTSRFLSERLYRHLSREEIKERTKLGRIENLRGHILHKGKAFVDPGEEEEFLECLDRLERTAATCLRILAGMAPGDDLDKYVKED
ncbi:MAG: hypothetical protein AMJ77_03870 [Dehalococcoidia bacterium SM23_28_2]|nr:MAG: hypothetical protein AMJ77_03870 [Dehalococcoidia bacterium SM23_28_2]